METVMKQDMQMILRLENPNLMGKLKEHQPPMIIDEQ